MKRLFLIFGSVISVAVVATSLFALSGSDFSSGNRPNKNPSRFDNVEVQGGIALGGTVIYNWSQAGDVWVATGTYVYTAGGGTDPLKVYFNGNISSTGTFTAYEYDMENGAVLDNGTNNTVTLVENSDTLSFVFDGTNIGLKFSDGSINLLPSNDTDDYITLTTIANVPTIGTSGSCDLNITSSSGAIGFDDENLTTTGTLSAGATTVTTLSSGTITLTNSETISNGTNGTITLSGASDMIVDVLATGTSNGDASLQLTSDGGDDNADFWKITNDGLTDSILFESKTSGSYATKLTLATTGALTMANDEIIDNITDDTVKVSSDNNDANLKVYAFEAKIASLELASDQDDNAGDIWSIYGSNSDGTSSTMYIGTDIVTADTRNAVVSIYLADNDTTGGAAVMTITALDNDTAANASLVLDADAGGDNADTWTIRSNATGNSLSFLNHTTEVFNLTSAGALQIDSNLTIGAGGDVDHEIVFNANSNDGRIIWKEDEDNFEIDNDVQIKGDLVVNTINFEDNETGTGDTYVVTLDPAPTAYVTGMMITFKASEANTGACSVNVNGLGPISLASLHDTTTVPDNYIEAGSVVVAVYDGTNFQMIQPDANP